uniref:Uncharacterized protein n=1 Tax=Anguilla anguilla TaxID=7936 RepID=A0A0E9T8W9_ANGAN
MVFFARLVASLTLQLMSSIPWTALSFMSISKYRDCTITEVLYPTFKSSQSSDILFISLLFLLCIFSCLIPLQYV